MYMYVSEFINVIITWYILAGERASPCNPADVQGAKSGSVRWDPGGSGKRTGVHVSDQTCLILACSFFFLCNVHLVVSSFAFFPLFYQFLPFPSFEG